MPFNINGTTVTHITFNGAQVDRVNYNGTKVYPSALQWQLQSMPAEAAFQPESVAWSPELALFVAVGRGASSNIMTSPDGVTWTLRSAPAANAIRQVVWAASIGLFVAVCSAYPGSDYNVLTSPDGINWTFRDSPKQDWHALAWSPELGLFVAVTGLGSYADVVMTSSDGIYWTLQTTPDTASGGYITLSSVAWSPELALFVAVGRDSQGNSNAMTSPDGISWTLRSITAGGDYYHFSSVAWSSVAGVFVAVGAWRSTTGGASEGAVIVTSPDGINWTARTVPGDNIGLSHVSWLPGPDVFVALSATLPQDVEKSMTSPDGISWTLRATPTGQDYRWYGAAWSPELYVIAAVANIPGESAGAVMMGELT